MSGVKGECPDPSSVLFLNSKGEPMRFYIRPGSTKVQLQPLITNGGGTLCRTQEPTAILLADPGDITAGVESAGQFYISAQYIRDCVVKNKQLNMENYRFSNLQPDKTKSASRSTGRMRYSLEDDKAILDFIDKRRHEAKGNQVWQVMQQQGVTAHSWQSMKNRFLKNLQFKLTNKSPKKRVRSFKESSLFEENISQTSVKTKKATPQKKNDDKLLVISSSDSDASQMSSDIQIKETPSDQAELQPSPEEGCLTELPDSEKNQPQAQSHDLHNEPPGEKPGRESLPEKEHQQSQQESEEPEVSTKRAQKDQHETQEQTSVDPTEHQTTLKRKRRISATHGRKLGILERAAREFEDSQVDGENQEDQPPSRTSSIDSDTDNLDTDESQIMAARERALREKEQDNESFNGQLNAPQVQSSRCTTTLAEDGPGPSSASVPVTSNAHMFIFDSESQEDLTQCSQKEPLSQDVLDAKEHVVKLMQECKKDLVDVMKALLKASGDLTLARSYLIDGYNCEVHGPLWTRRDDEILLSGGSSNLEQLHAKYGTDRVSKRLAYLQ